jgi:hypothetical protein
VDFCKVGVSFSLKEIGMRGNTRTIIVTGQVATIGAMDEFMREAMRMIYEKVMESLRSDQKMSTWEVFIKGSGLDTDAWSFRRVLAIMMAIGRTVSTTAKESFASAHFGIQYKERHHPTFQS